MLNSEFIERKLVWCYTQYSKILIRLKMLCRLIFFPTNTPCVFRVEATWKRSFSRRFKVEYTWCVCSLISKKPSLPLKSKFHPGRFTNFIEHFKSLFLRTNLEWQKQNYLCFLSHNLTSHQGHVLQYKLFDNFRKSFTKYLRRNSISVKSFTTVSKNLLL